MNTISSISSGDVQLQKKALLKLLAALWVDVED